MTRNEYTVGWICALPIELAAAAEILDKEHQDLPQDSTDTNSYSFGRIGEHNIVVTYLPARQLGISSAAAVASQIKSRFPSIRFSLIVGIGSGIPSTEADIRLGNVVISQPFAQHGGVVQYDFGKTGPEGRFTRTGSLNAPPPILLAALTKLRSNYIRRRVKLSEHLSPLDRLPEFIYQGAEYNTLYKPTYNHARGPTYNSYTENRLVMRIPRPNADTLLYFRTIASRNQVIKDGVTRDRLSAELSGILCFKIEAAGLINNFPYLIIRGICDYTDSHKNKRWQPYTAATAAGCAKELLNTIPGDAMVG